MESDNTLSEMAYRKLIEEIVTCQLPPGIRLAQASLSKQLSIGLTPIRDALQRLALEGFVEAIPRHGYIVTAIDLAYLEEVFEMRLILEQAAANLAVERGATEDLESIRSMADFQYKYKRRDTYLSFLERNTQFHLAIAKATENGRLVDSLSKLLVEMTRVFHFGLDLRDSAEEMHTEHVLLADALLERNSRQALELMGNQIDASKNRIVEAMFNKSGKLKVRSQGKGNPHSITQTKR